VLVLSVPGNIIYNNSNNMHMCMCMYRERKRETRNIGRESKSQSFRWSLRVNKQEARKDIEGEVKIAFFVTSGDYMCDIMSFNLHYYVV